MSLSLSGHVSLSVHGNTVRLMSRLTITAPSLASAVLIQNVSDAIWGKRFLSAQVRPYRFVLKQGQS
jgi:hypothetical protein